MSPCARAGAIALLGVVLSASALNAAEKVAFLGYVDGYWQLWVMRPDGSDLRQVTTSSTEKASLSWYPDGSAVLVLELPERLVRIDVETGAAREVDLGLTGIHDADVGPEGDRIAVAATTGDIRDTHDLWLVSLNGERPRRLVAMPELQHQPRWHPDGESVYFLSGKGDQDHEIWRVDVASGATQQVTVGARYHFEVDVSRKGALAYSSNRTGDYELYVQPQKGPVERWTRSDGLDGHPTFSPEGDALIFHSAREGVINLWRQEAPDAEAVRLTSFPEGARGPEWWSDQR